MMFEKMNVLGINFDNCTEKEALQKADEVIQAHKPSYIVIENLYEISLCIDNQEMMNFHNNASLVLTESENVLRLARRLKTPIKEKVDTIHYLYELCKMASQKGYRLFLLGGSPGAAEAAAKNLTELNPKLTVAGTYAPPFGFENDEVELRRIVTMLKGSMADILFVGLGSPKQDNFIEAYMGEYNIPLSIPVGRGIDVIGGQFKRPPKWITNFGFEWLHRCFQDPKLFKRRYFSRGIKIIRCYWKFKRQQNL